jgi:hypothetical protein
MNDEKIICIATFSGRNIYVRTTQEKWLELTKGVEVFTGGMVVGWHLDQVKIEKIITGAYPEREEFKVVAIKPHREYLAQLGLEYVLTPPVPNYYIVYSNIDMPTQIRGEFR